MGEEKNKYEGNLHRRFVMRVLLPPFIALLFLSLIGLWQLDSLLRRQATDNLRRSATTTAAALERELALRKTVSKRTGEELLVIKNQYQDTRKTLDIKRDACREFIRKDRNFRNSPGGACEPFTVGLANNGVSLAALEDEYVVVVGALATEQNQRINERLSAFKQFFPETLAVIIADKDNQVVSSALSGALKGSTEAFATSTKDALTSSVNGRQLVVESFQLGLFAYPIAGGSVLAAYDLYNEQFIRQTWDQAPIDRKQAIAVILDSEDNVAYPNIKNTESFKTSGSALRSEKPTEINLDGVQHTVLAAQAGSSGWLVAIASPTAAVLAPSRDAQLAGLIFLGLFMVGFAWVGSFFVQRTLKNIVRLVSGAMVFGTGRLDYKIELDHADSEFVRLGETMNQMAARIAQAEKELDEKNREFISVATHELRAPMTAIIGHLSLFKEMHDDKLDPNAKLLVDQAYYGTARLRDLVNDMLNVARLESGKSEFALTPVSIKTVIEEIVDTMNVVAAIAKVKLAYQNDNATEVIADENRLRIIINNFVSNAIKYNRPDGKVVISHHIKDNQLVTVISDTGLGIPDDQKEHMFEKFFRVDNADRKSVAGTGLGMYIVKQYIDQMHGVLWFESTHGKGTKFYFSLPLAKVTLRVKVSSKIEKAVKRVEPSHATKAH